MSKSLALLSFVSIFIVAPPAHHIAEHSPRDLCIIGSAQEILTSLPRVTIASEIGELHDVPLIAIEVTENGSRVDWNSILVARHPQQWSGEGPDSDRCYQISCTNPDGTYIFGYDKGPQILSITQYLDMPIQRLANRSMQHSLTCS